MGESGRRSSAAPATCAPLHNFCGGAICGNPKPSAALDGVLHASTTATWRRQQPAFGVVAIIAALDLLDGMRRRASAAVRLLGWCMIVGDGARFMGGGYVGDDEASAATMNSEGWLKTGDLCYFNEDGFLYIVDRSKELIKYKGYQVPPLEHILNSHPDIMDAAVIPYPDEDVEQLPMAFIVRNPGSNLTEQQVMDYVAKQSCIHLLISV